MKKWRLLAAVLGLVCLLWFQTAFSQDQESECPDCPPKRDKADKTITLEEVLVTAFHGGAVTITPTKTIVDMRKFEKSGSVDRVEDVLMQMAGIDVMRTSTGADPQQIVMMRGLDDSRFTVALDGRPLTTPTAGADTYVDWSSLTTGDVERIEIIRSGASARYENSQGGVINIITKKGKRGDTLKPKVTLESTYSSFDTYVERATCGGGIGNLGYFLNAGYKTSDGYLRNNSWEGEDYSGRIDYSLPTNGTLALSYKMSRLELEYPVVNDPALASYDSSYPTVRQDADTIRRFRLISYPGGKSYKKKKADHLDFSFDQPLGDTKLSLRLFQDTGEEDSYSYQRSGTRLVQTFSGNKDRQEKTVGGMLDYEMNLWDNNSLTVGYSQRRMEVASKPDIWRIQAGYFEDLLAITPKLSLNLGLRYLNVRNYTYEYKDYGGSVSYRHLLHEDLWLPKATLSYRFNPETEAYVSANKDYHMPGC